MKKIKARYKGKHGNQGFRKGCYYTLVYSELNIFVRLFSGIGIQVWRLEPDSSQQTALNYPDKKAFKKSWSVLHVIK